MNIKNDFKTIRAHIISGQCVHLNGNEILLCNSTLNQKYTLESLIKLCAEIDEILKIGRMRSYRELGLTDKQLISQDEHVHSIDYLVRVNIDCFRCSEYVEKLLIMVAFSGYVDFDCIMNIVNFLPYDVSDKVIIVLMEMNNFNFDMLNHYNQKIFAKLFFNNPGLTRKNIDKFCDFIGDGCYDIDPYLYHQHVKLTKDDLLILYTLYKQFFEDGTLRLYHDYNPKNSKIKEYVTLANSKDIVIGRAKNPIMKGFSILRGATLRYFLNVFI